MGERGKGPQVRSRFLGGERALVKVVQRRDDLVGKEPLERSRGRA